MLNIVGIEFKDNGKIYYFNSRDLNLKLNDNVIVGTERGLQYGKVVSDIKQISNNAASHNLYEVVRVASKDDQYQYMKNIEDGEKALTKAIKLAKDLNLNMRFTEVCYTFDRNQLILYFLSENRVDFRELAKQLASIYRTRIELRQIGVRDKAKEISGIGPCGRQLCCASFLNDLDAVSISMAKNQNLALNPTKINGLCGRLLCCLNYEDDLYTENREGMPEVGDIVKTDEGRGLVISVDILNRKYTINVENEGKKVIQLNQECKKCEKCKK